MEKYFLITNGILVIIIIIMVIYLLFNRPKEIIIYKEITTSKDLMKGLMFVKKKLPKRTGLLFNYNKTKNVSFWMKNTYIPLDIIGLNEKYEIVELAENMVPLDTNLVQMNDIKFAIEVNAGTIKDMELDKGEKIKLIKEKKN